MHFGKRKERKAQQVPSLHGRSDTPNSWKEKKGKYQAMSPSMKSQTNLTPKQRKKPGILPSWNVSLT